MTKPTTTDLQDVEEHERRLTLLADELDKRALSLLAECGSASNARLVTSSARGLCEAAVKARRAASELASKRADRDQIDRLTKHERDMAGIGRRAAGRSPLRRRQS